MTIEEMLRMINSQDDNLEPGYMNVKDEEFYQIINCYEDQLRNPEDKNRTIRKMLGMEQSEPVTKEVELIASEYLKSEFASQLPETENGKYRPEDIRDLFDMVGNVPVRMTTIEEIEEREHNGIEISR